MTLVAVRNLDSIRKRDPRLYEALSDIQASLVPQTQDPPPPVTAINAVSLGNGAVDVTIADGGPVNQSVHYFVEHADNPQFLNPRVEHFGASRNGTIVVGTHDRYIRAYSQHTYPPSQPNTPVNFGGGTPTAINGGGATTPALMASTGSGIGSCKRPAGRRRIWKGARATGDNEPMIRNYEPLDLDRVRQLHGTCGFDYALPDLDAPSMVVKRVMEGDGEVRALALLKLTAEAFLLMDGQWRSPAWRWEMLKRLHEDVRQEGKLSVIG